MKKYASWICGMAVCAAAFTAPVAAFNDISDPTTMVAADTLAYMQVLSGYGDGTFRPGGNLTRAEFCTIMITAIKEKGAADSYKNYTIFPDVPHTHWGSGYINLAVKTPLGGEDSKEMLLSGYPDGTFRPENSITLGEAVTVTLRVLGYKTADVGMFWPQDYVSKAQEIGLLKNISNIDGNRPIQRGEAAVLVYNMFLTQNKEGIMYARSGVFSSVEEDRVILSDSSTDFDLIDNQIRISPLQVTDGGAPIYTTDRPVPKTLMGQKGLLVLEGGGDGVKGFLPYRSTRREYVVSKTTASAITASDGTKLSISNSMPVILDGEIKKYGDCFFDLLPGNTVSISYGSSGAMECISLSAGLASQGPFVLTSDGGLANLFGSATGTIYKNGVKVQAKDLKKYDVVSYDSASKVFYASDRKISGILEDGIPALQNPSKVKVLGTEFDVVEHARASFEKRKLGEGVTLLLTSDGKVAGVVPTSEYQAAQYAVVDSVSEKQLSLTMLPSGQKIEGEADAGYSQMVGEIVQVRVSSSGKIALSKAVFSKTNDTLSIQNRTLGEKNLPANVRVFEKMGYFSTPVAIELDTIHYMDEVKSSFIEGVLKDSSGNPVVIVLKDATGAGYRYGKISSISEKKDEEGYIIQHREVAVTTLNADGEAEKVSGQALGGFSTPFLYGGVAFNKNGNAVAAVSLEKVATVGLADFHREEYVTVQGRRLPIMDDVPVYLEATENIVPLSRAKALCAEFTVYINPQVKNGEVVRMIVAK